MSDEMLKKIDALGSRAVSRRGFLRGGAIAAAIVGAAAALPAVAGAQEPQQSQDSKPKPDPDQSSSAGGDNTDNSSSGDSETKTDSQGRPYRVCPQCGGNMYQQGRTWTCENCGYSYVE